MSNDKPKFALHYTSGSFQLMKKLHERAKENGIDHEIDFILRFKTKEDMKKFLKPNKRPKG